MDERTTANHHIGDGADAVLPHGLCLGPVHDPDAIRVLIVISGSESFRPALTSSLIAPLCLPGARRSGHRPASSRFVPPPRETSGRAPSWVRPSNGCSIVECCVLLGSCHWASPRQKKEPGLRLAHNLHRCFGTMRDKPGHQVMFIRHFKAKSYRETLHPMDLSALTR